jgi:DNA-binding phage protein
MPLCRALGKGLWEVRSDLTQGRIARVLFCIEDSRMVLLHAFVKKTQKTPPGDETKEGDHMKKKGRIGSSFDDFLKDKGIYAEVSARAIKRVIARQLDTLMRDQGLTKSALAKRMQTSRTQLDRLLDPDNESVTLDTLTRAAQAVGRHLRMELV